MKDRIKRGWKQNKKQTPGRKKGEGERQGRERV